MDHPLVNNIPIPIGNVLKALREAYDYLDLIISDPCMINTYKDSKLTVSYTKEPINSHADSAYWLVAFI